VKYNPTFFTISQSYSTLSSALSIDSNAQQIASLVSSVLSLNAQRLQTCLTDNVNYLTWAYYPFYVGYNNCTTMNV
jgi:hypothetical protein